MAESYVKVREEYKRRIPDNEIIFTEGIIRDIGGRREQIKSIEYEIDTAH